MHLRCACTAGRITSPLFMSRVVFAGVLVWPLHPVMGQLRSGIFPKRNVCWPSLTTPMRCGAVPGTRVVIFWLRVPWITPLKSGMSTGNFWFLWLTLRHSNYRTVSAFNMEIDFVARLMIIAAKRRVYAKNYLGWLEVLHANFKMGAREAIRKGWLN